ncbi:MAG: hypothetical protein ACTHMT_01800, partial [Verrucomicrobiota bacterium]
RVKEKEDDKARAQARKKERASRVASTDHIFELSLDMVEKKLPVEPYVAAKAKEDGEQLALASATESSDPDLDDEMDPENEPVIDPQLDEVINVLRDYSRLLEKNHQSAVVLKND